ncbi:methyltransferase type 11 [Thioalkalivibrio denitrificans]|uniref:Methyltransferase type 11 n=1 Tax=Thioalkalivibrio denitrificans TaxID=108003 RepID=A0A1V3NS10_9GAMM|nr:MerC family mercury resistance protein [Thioalkalivibrio denitrificans]OOG27831.1 methyltransferase type 11 [Thioalkalivibrio denitrificans]
MVAILGYSREQIFTAVKDMYTAVADAPLSHFHFPVGDDACRTLGYPPEQVDTLPGAIRESFAGVGYPFRAEAVRRGDTVLDIGAGAGNDAVIASRIAGPEGHVVALDLTPAMTRKLKSAVSESGIDNVSVVQASAERLPLADASVDSITSNGALNLVPDKRRAVSEMFRVLRPGGRVQLADVVIRRPVTVDCHEDPRLWVECVVGATVDEDLLTMFRDAGFEDVEVVRELDYFSHSPSEQTREVAASFDARSLELGMRRGARAPSPLVQWLKRMNPARWLKSMWRRGFLGMASLAAALVVCYGTLAALALLGVLGIGLALDEGLWAGAIALFAVLAAIAVVAGMRRHRSPGPSVPAVAGAGVILYALFVDYSMVVELAGFVLLAAAAFWDLRLRRRVQTQVLGLEAA